MISLYGLGASDDATANVPHASSIQSEVDGFLLKSPSPSSADIASFLRLYSSGDKRNAAAQELITRGVDPGAISAALNFLDTSGSITKSTVYGLLSIASAAASGYHGVRRNKGSIGWGIWWFAMGGLFPVITPVVAVAQGFGKPKAS